MLDRCEQQFANYRLVKLLGTGGFAEVYLGEHVLSNISKGDIPNINIPNIRGNGSLLVILMLIAGIVLGIILLCFQGSYTVSCSNSDDKFVFRDSLSHFQDLCWEIEAGVTRVKGAPWKSEQGMVQWL